MKNIVLFLNIFFNVSFFYIPFLNFIFSISFLYFLYIRSSVSFFVHENWWLKNQWKQLITIHSNYKLPKLSIEYIISFVSFTFWYFSYFSFSNLFDQFFCFDIQFLIFQFFVWIEFFAANMFCCHNTKVFWWR